VSLLRLNLRELHSVVRILSDRIEMSLRKRGEKMVWKQKSGLTSM
jgi:hypothetical protein